MSNRIKVENLSVEYQLYDSYLKQGLDFLFANAPSRLGFIKVKKKAALTGINLSINSGERVGIIGSNGAGKTTLLKSIIGSLKPKEGSAVLHGNILPLMTTGLGFHPELTGLENIKISLTFGGVPKKKQDSLISEIINFVELGDYINQPIRTYSLGMTARLGFAASTATSPDILIIDEVLGAGDSYFNNKCNQRIKKLSENGTTLLIVSHSMEQILAFSERVIWMNDGKIVMDGKPQDVVRSYDSFMSHKISNTLQASNNLKIESHKLSRWSGSGEFSIEDFKITAKEQEKYTLAVCEDVRFGLKIKKNSDLENLPLMVIYAIFTPRGELVAQLKSESVAIKKDSLSFTVENDVQMTLGPGDYLISVSLHRYYAPSEPATNQIYDLIDRSFTFSVVDRDRIGSTNIMNCEWSFGEIS